MIALIIDDEPQARNLLKVILEENCEQIKQIQTAKNVLEGVDKIKSITPDIVFLDIEMPDHSGLELLDFLADVPVTFEIVFTTAYNDFATQAFELSAVDYLLKPLRPVQVKKAVDKCIAIRGKSQINMKLQELKESLSLSEFKKIGLPVSDGIKFVALQDIIVFEGDGMYCKIQTNKEQLYISKPLKYFSDLLADISYFYKPHKSFLINLKYIKQYVKSDGGYILLDNDYHVSISKEKKEEFLAIVSNI